ncbi:hypothetical protein LXL04_019685 [Taraxacum kok-saghyz]
MVNPLQSFSGIERRGKKKKTRDGEPALRKKQRRKITGGFLLSRVQKDRDTPHSGLRKIAGFNGFRHTDTAHPYEDVLVGNVDSTPFSIKIKHQFVEPFRFDFQWMNKGKEIFISY